MYNIKWVDDKIDYKSLISLDWDIVVKHRKYKAYHIDGYYHSVGSRYDDVWCCPRDEEPSKENLIGYGAASICSWGIEISDLKYHNFKHEDIENKIHVIITRNGDHFYDFSCNDFSYGLSKAQVLITNIKEHPINFSEYEFNKKIIGRKIFYRDEPAIITDYCEGQCSIIIEPDGIEKFSAPCWAEGDWEEYEKSLKIDCLEDNSVWWFRYDGN